MESGSMSLPIVQIGNPVLRKKSHKIPRVTAETRRLADEMLETMREAHGVGLAAPQVGELQLPDRKSVV